MISFSAFYHISGFLTCFTVYFTFILHEFQLLKISGLVFVEYLSVPYTSCSTMLNIPPNFFKESEKQFLGNILGFFSQSLHNGYKHFILLTVPLTRLSIGTLISVLLDTFSMADVGCQ